MRVDVTKFHVSLDLKGLFINNGIRDRLEGKDCDVINVEFLFVGAFVDQATGKWLDYCMIRVHRMFSELAIWLKWKEVKRY